jgi:hypothetical protein
MYRLGPIDERIVLNAPAEHYSQPIRHSLGIASPDTPTFLWVLSSRQRLRDNCIWPEMIF